jgi:molybdopterin-containing oxidoreductase family membrane subunit
MWFERFNIVVTSLSKNYIPANWASYSPTIIEIGLFVGTLGMFSAGVLLFFRYIPMIAISEIKSVSKHDKEPDLTQFLSHETQENQAKH